MLWWLTQHTLTVAALAGLAAGLCRLGRPSPATRHALWLVVLLKLLTPPLVSWPWSPPGSAHGAGDRPAVVATAEGRHDLPADPGLETATAEPALPEETIASVGAGEGVPVEIPGPAKARAAPAASAPAEAEPVQPSAGRASRQGGWLSSGLLYLWLTGALLAATWQLVQVLRFRRRLVHAGPAPAWLAGELEQWAIRLGVRPPVVRVLPGIGSPLVWSLGRATLLWPVGLLDGLSAHCRQGVLVHELAHLRRRDHWVGWLQVLGVCLWWWHPLFWYVRRHLRANAELACDAWVLAVLPGARRAYAEALIEVSERVSRLAAVPALGISGSRRDFERRLTMIMREQVRCRVSRGGLVALGALALVALPAWSLGQDKKPADDTAAQKAPGADKVDPLLKGRTVLDGADRNVEKGGPATNRDRRLEAVEQQLQALLREVRSLRGGPTRPGRAADKAVHALNELSDRARVQLGHELLDRMDVEGAADREGVQVITLTRAKYKLPPGRATALAAFLRTHLKVDPLDVKVGDGGLTVTTTAEAQKTIGQLIRLMRTDDQPAPSRGEDGGTPMRS